MNRRGSALLIVLGFLSFMVVSAVAFSIYMRSERVPSSVFRKNAAVRQLVRAGLARAITELDNVIRDDPFPGVIRKPDDSGSGSRICKYMKNARRNIPVDPPYDGLAGSRRYIDWWYGRVFMPPNPDDEEDGSLFAPESETVSVVTLEGLGYVPPPLINDVRILSRGSWTAKWRDFDYGVGRYAYCAVNVSDYFDINRMTIAEPRTGFSRVSLAALFTKNETSVDVDTGKAEAFANFVASPGSGGGGAQSSWPLVSMLDYALANESGRNGFSSYPFYKWIYNTTSRRTIYESQTDDARQQIFVTDSWYPSSYKVSARPTLDMDETGNRRGQPFDLNTFNDLAMTPQPLSRLLTATFPNATGENGVKFDDMLSATEIAALYDYLDRDDIPTSLALPTVERNPMVVAISPQAQNVELKVPVTALQQATAQDRNPPPTPVNFDPSGFNEIARSGLRVMLAYPFKHGKLGSMNLDSANYQVQAVAKIFLVEKSKIPGTRGKAFGDANYNTAVFRPKDQDYSGNSSVDNNVITLVAQPQNVSFSGGDDMTKDVMVRFQPFSENVTVAEHTSTWEEEKDAQGTVIGGHAKSTWNIKFFPINVEGNPVTPSGYSTNADTLPTDQNGYVAVMAVWVRVKDVSRNFVADCVPATFYEDTFNGLPQNALPSPQDVCGNKEPLLRFTVENSAPEFQYSGIVGGAATGPFTSTVNYDTAKQKWQQRTIWAVDPRYNHAPEDWCMETGSEELSGQDWENKALNAAARDNGGDGEIYLAVSNQGFLQSMGELACLPRVKEHFSDSYTGGPMWGRLWKEKRGEAYRNGISEYPTSPSVDLRDMVWRTYEPWDNETNGDNLFGCGIADHPGYGAVNPYSDNTRVLMAALANTPVNWLVAAGTNTVKDASRGQNKGDTIANRRSNFRTLKESLKFAYNTEGDAKNEDRLLEFDALQNMANEMKIAFRKGVATGESWEKIYDSWEWEPQGRPFTWAGAGSEFYKQLDSIDCRFLYSFWRGCFANRQQLFLVFVRAESTALGGSGEGQIPPQQGGRAVALVWRDPETPNGGNDTAQIDSTSYRPHRTRVLFYHQFD